MYRCLALCFALLCCQSAWAEIYICAQDGVKAAQDKPCADTDRDKTIHVIRPKASNDIDLCSIPGANCSLNGAWQYAESVCPKLVERMAKYGFQWVEGLTVFKIEPRHEKTEKSHLVKFFGDKVKFQNGFGAWSNMVYVCTFDLSQRKIVDVNVFKGRL